MNPLVLTLLTKLGLSLAGLTKMAFRIQSKSASDKDVDLLRVIRSVVASEAGATGIELIASSNGVCPDDMTSRHIGTVAAMCGLSVADGNWRNKVLRLIDDALEGQPISDTVTMVTECPNCKFIFGV